jgi:hypothetical protein
MKHWMQTSTGKAVDLENPDISFEDIAISLSKQARYAGHTKGFGHYSVAEHCVHVARHRQFEKGYLTKRQRWNLLMHDAREGVMQDMISPWKALMPDFKQHELRVAEAIAKKFDLDWPDPDYVKELDWRILADERDQCMATAPLDWGIGDAKPLGIVVKWYDAHSAYRHFTNAAKEFAHVPLD